MDRFTAALSACDEFMAALDALEDDVIEVTVRVRRPIDVDEWTMDLHTTHHVERARLARRDPTFGYGLMGKRA